MKCHSQWHTLDSSRQLCPLEVGEDNSELEPKQLEFKSIKMVRQKVVTAELTEAKSKSVLSFLALLLLIADFCLFSVEPRRSDFPECMPLVCLNCTFKHQRF